MERFRRRRAHARVSSTVKVATIVAQSSENWIIPIYPKVNQVLGKHNKLPKLASRSSNCSSIATLEENQLSFDLGRGSGIPMKKLLADEMSKETESGRRSPSIIARLMGLDGLSASHNTNKKQKRLSDSHHRGSSSTGFSKNSKHHDSRSHRKAAMGQQQFKDVYEVMDRSNMETRSTTSLAASCQNFSENEIGFIRQKFMDAKRFSTDEDFQHSKEFHDAIEVLESNKDLFLRFLQEPDSLFRKHLHHLRNAPESYSGCMNSKNALKCNIDALGCQKGAEASQKIDVRHSHKHRSSCHAYADVYDRHSTGLHKLSFSSEVNENASSIPTKIVLLKPNVGKMFNNTKSASSTTSCDAQSDFELYNECPSVKHPSSKVRGKRNKYEDSDNYGRKSQESRELAREITRQMKNKLGVDAFNVPSFGYKGYSADESSHDTSENDSSCESEVTFVSSRTSSNRTVRCKSSSSRYMESSVNMEGKKRLSERWKLIHRSQEHGESSKGSTLAEMLAIPDVDIRPRSPDFAVARDECVRRFGRNDGTAELNTPLGISSRDGWKDGCIQNLSRSRSLPTSANHLGSPKSSTKREAIAAERFLIRKESIGHARNKVIRRDSRRKDGSFSDYKNPSDEKCQSFGPAKMVDDIYEVQSSGNMIKNTTDGKDSPEVKTVILETTSCRNDTCLPLDGEVPAREIPSCVLSQDGSSTSDMPSLPQVGGSSCLQCTATHLESPASKESEQPSPVSVLEASFVEDLSSGSECFERVSAELHGLRLQLQLLKRESEDYEEGSILISSDEYAEESAELCDGKHSPQVGGGYWKSWYLVDVLALCGLDRTDCELFLGTWNSPECPIGSWVFEDLEKRYSELESCSRSDRRLLFDHINARIVEISQPFLHMEPWVKKPGKNIDPEWLKDVLKTELHNLLEKHENKVIEDALDTVLLSDMRWMELGEHISAVGRDIEALLIDELVTESLLG